MLAPRLNAAGRLETAQSAYQTLITRDDQEAGLLAQRLDDQNKDGSASRVRFNKQ
jgi:single-stranded-DNA-specific exonuclease